MAQPQRNSAQWCAMRMLAWFGICSLAAQPPATAPGAASGSYVEPRMLSTT